MRQINFDNIYSILLDHVLDNTPFSEVLNSIHRETGLPMIVFDVSFNLITYCFPRPFYIPGWEHLAEAGSASESLVLSNDYFRLEEVILQGKKSMIVDTAGRTEYKTAFGPIFQNGVLRAYSAIVVEDVEESDVIILNDMICNTFLLSKGSYLLSSDERLAENLLSGAPILEAFIPGFMERHAGPYRTACILISNIGSARQNYISNRLASVKDCFAVLKDDSINLLFTQSESGEILRMLENVARNYTCPIGVSDRFDDPKAVETGLIQARMALHVHVSMKKDPSVLFFTSCYLDAIALLMDETYQLNRHYVLPRINIIRASYPHKADILEITLSEYLANGGSINATAASMNLHKNTIKYRLDMIAKVLNERLDNPDVYDALLLELKLSHTVKRKEKLRENSN